MFKTYWAILALWLGGLALSVSSAETYPLANGTTLNGDILSFNDAAIKFRLGEDHYSDPIPWTQFSQEGLKKLAQNPKIRPIVEPFIEPPPVEKHAPAGNLKLQDATRLERPARHSLLGGLASSALGCFLLALMYAANLYGAFEVAGCRGRTVASVMGVSAVLPIVGPAIFYFLPTLYKGDPTESSPAAAGEAGNAAGAPAAPGMAGEPAPAAAAAPESEVTPIQATPVSTAASAPAVLQVYRRGQFTFNRRFIETKFAGFFSPVRSQADQKLDLIVKLSKGTHLVQCLSNISQNDVQLEVLQDGRLLTILAPFADIQEITIQTKAA